MSDDRDVAGAQDRTEGPDGTPRPASAAARRERRAAARPSDRDAGTLTTGKGRPTQMRDRGQQRASLPARVARFLREVVAELQKVIWPTRKELVTYTAVVLVFVAFMVALVAGLDIVFAKGMFFVFGD